MVYGKCPVCADRSDLPRAVGQYYINAVADADRHIRFQIPIVELPFPTRLSVATESSMTGDEIPTKLSKGGSESDNERPQRMKDWLIEQINSSSYDGLQWVDEEKTIFRVPWIHAKKRGYNAERDAALFRAWAKHTGKYKGEGDATTWKINFRCALNGLKDIVELKDNQTENFRMYRLLPDTGRKRKASGNRIQRMTDFPPMEGVPMTFPTYHTYLPPCFPPDGIYDFMAPPPCRWPATAVFPPPASFISPEPPICISYPNGMEEMKPFPQPVVGGHIQMAPATKPMAMQMPCISTAPPLGPPPQYTPADGSSYNGEYLGEPSPKQMCMKADPALDHANCPLSYSQSTPVYSDASPASASSGSPLNIDDEPQHSPCRLSPPHMAMNYPPTSVTSPCDQTNLTSQLPFEYPHPLTPPQAPPPSGPRAIQVALSYGGATLRTENIVCPQAGCHVFANMWSPGDKDIDHQLAVAFPFKMPAPLSSQVQPILDSVTRGLLIEVSNNDIYVTNLTQLPCYHGTSPSHLAHCRPLQPDLREKVFDYCLFKESLDAHFHGQSEAPTPSVALSMGEPWGHGRHLSHTMVSVVVTLLQAQHELESVGIRPLPEHSFFPPTTSLPMPPAHYEEECLPPPGPAPPTHDFHTAPL